MAYKVSDKTGIPMRPLAISLCLLITLTLVAAPASVLGGDASESRGLLQAPQGIKQVWLHFHEIDLCQEMDALFVFSKKGMEVWCLIENEKDYQKLQELVEPLESSYQIGLYPARAPRDEKSRDDWDPPASLWENYELRSYLGDSFARARERLAPDIWSNMDFPPMDEVLRQRLFVYADQILKWDLEMKRYATDLPALTELALDPGSAYKLRAAAATIGRIHAQKLDKTLEKMTKSLGHAFPDYDKQEDSSSRRENPDSESESALDRAMQIAAEARNLSLRVNRFIYPNQFAVDLKELRQPGLLKDLLTVEKLLSGYQKMLAKPVRK